MTTYPAYRVCRLCKNRGSTGLNRYTIETRLLKYGTRHYAHHECYLKADKPLTELPTWQLESFPYRLIRERGPEFAGAFENLLLEKQAEDELRAARVRAVIATREQAAMRDSSPMTNGSALDRHFAKRER